MKTNRPTLRFTAIPALALAGSLLAATTGLHADTYTHPTSGLVLEYTVANGEATVTGGTVPTEENNPDKGKLIIPETLGGAPVTAIGESAFAGEHQAPNTAITRLEAPSVERIEANAFSNCTALTDIKLPQTTTIKGYVFSHCSALTRVALPKLVSTEFAAFSPCTSLISISLPETSSIGAYTFWGCTELKDIYLGKSPTLGEDAFDSTHADLTIHHHPEHSQHFADGNWASLTKNEVVRPFSQPVDIAAGSGSATLTIRHAATTDSNDDWTYTVEQSTDLAAWTEATPTTSDSNTADSVVTKSRTIPATAPAAFYRVQAKPAFFSTD